MKSIINSYIFLFFVATIPFALTSCNDSESCEELTWYFDGDGDQLGTADSVKMACDQPLNFVANADDEDDALADGIGSVTIMFDNVVGDSDLSLSEASSTDSFPYTNENQQTFNLDLLGYYISEIELISDGGEDFVDEVAVSAEGAEGFFHILENDQASQMIMLADVPDGKFNKIKFTLGVRGDIVQEGAIGGILDPSNGAWFWNWNAGYVAFMMEGNSPESGSQTDSHFEFHIGGWATPNNIHEIILDFPHHLLVADGTSSMIHIEMDVLDALSGHMNVDFGTTFSVHSPVAGEHISQNLTNAFHVHHVENE